MTEVTKMIWTAALWVSLQLSSPLLHTDGTQFKDAQGRVIVLRGINVSGDAKLPPFMPIQSAKTLDPLRTWGFNMMRLLFIWEAFEPTRGNYNMAYLDYIARVARWGEARGIMTVVDFHQDALSRFVARGCGEGFPEWVLPADIPRQLPDNGPNCANWFAIQWLDSDVRKTWQAFYRDEQGIREAYMAMAQRAAEHLSKVVGVVGYDLLNEPAGDETTELSPLYEEMAVRLSKAHPGALLLIEPDAKAVIGLQSGLPAPGFANAVYAPHFYDGFTRLVGTYLGYPMTYAFGNMRAKSEALHLPLVLGEFGIPPTLGGANGYMRATYDRLDEAFASSAQWGFSPGWNAQDKDGWNVEDFSITDPHGNLRDNFRPRPYAQAIAGAPVQLRVNEADRPQERSAELVWQHNPAAGATEMYVPEHEFFASPPQVHTEGSDVQCSLQGTKLTCTAATPGLKRVRLAL